MTKELTRIGVVGLELTREEVNDMLGEVKALIRKAQCREVNECVINQLVHIEDELDAVDSMLTGILDLDDDEDAE